MGFGGGILGSAHKIWGDPYLNSMTILFDLYWAVAIEQYLKIYLVPTT